MSEFQVYAKLNGEGFAAWELIKTVHQGVDFSCPYCEKAMRPIMGIKRIWHFRHKVKGECSGGGESEFHFKMKYWFVRKANEHGIEYHVEKRVKDESSHRPDVILYFDKIDQKKLRCEGLAVEFQNSPIDLSSVLDRNTTYLNQNLTPWWVFGGRYYLKLQSTIIEKGEITKDVFQMLFEDFDKITFLEEQLYHIEPIHRNKLAKVPVSFIESYQYHKGKHMPELIGSLKKYETKRRGFYIKRGKKWVAYPLIFEQYQNRLVKKIDSMDEKVRNIRSRVYEIQRKLEEINIRLDGFDKHPYFFQSYINSYFKDLTEKGKLTYRDSISQLASLGLDWVIATNIIDYLLRRNQIFRVGTVLLSKVYWEKILEQRQIIIENRSQLVYFEDMGKRIRVPIWFTPEMEDKLMEYIVYEWAIRVWNCIVWLRENVDRSCGHNSAVTVLNYLIRRGKITRNPQDGFYYPVKGHQSQSSMG